MECPNCNTVGSGIHDDNHLWCDNCGHAIKDEVQYVTGYCQSHFSRSQIYCRVKRFGKYITRICSDLAVLQRFHDILDLYSCFEFAWIRNIGDSTRIYFSQSPSCSRCAVCFWTSKRTWEGSKTKIESSTSFGSWRHSLTAENGRPCMRSKAAQKWWLTQSTRDLRIFGLKIG